jgi:hypothetical protein
MQPAAEAADGRQAQARAVADPGPVAERVELAEALADPAGDRVADALQDVAGEAGDRLGGGLDAFEDPGGERLVEILDAGDDALDEFRAEVFDDLPRVFGVRLDLGLDRFERASDGFFGTCSMPCSSRRRAGR